MPINSCQLENKPGFKWGDSGHCYTYDPEKPESQKRARRQCLLQARAVLASQARAAAEKAVGGVGAPQVTRKKMLGGDERTVVRMGSNEIEIYEQGGRWHLTPNYRTSEGFVAQMSEKDAIVRAQMALRDIAQVQRQQQEAARVVRDLPPVAKDILLTTSKRYPPAITLSPKGVEAAQPLVQAGLATITGTRITLTKAGEDVGMNFQGKALPPGLSGNAQKLLALLKEQQGGTVTSSLRGVPQVYRELERAGLAVVVNPYALNPQLRITEKGQAA